MSRSRRKNRKGPAKATTAPNFWAPDEPIPTLIEPFAVTANPLALIQSLGPVPVGAHDDLAMRNLAMIITKAAGVATALAASSGLLDDSDDHSPAGPTLTS